MKYLPFLFLLFLPGYVQAQQDVDDYKSENKNLYSLIGISLGAGAHAMDLRELNKKLRQFDIPKLNPDAGAREWQLHMGNDFLLATTYLILIDANQSSAPLRPEPRFNFTSLSGQYLGFDLSINSLDKKRWQINFPSLGINYSNFQLKIDSISNAKVPSLVNLTTTQSNLIILNSKNNLNIKAGAEFYYRTGWFKKHVYDIKFGLKTGYILPVSNNPWQQANSNAVIPELPVIDKGSYYLMFQIIGVMLELADKTN